MPTHPRAWTGDDGAGAYPHLREHRPQYPVRELALEPGGRVVLYSEGIIEALTPEDDMFGYERTARAARLTGGSAEAGIDRIMGAVQAHARRDMPHDDQTMAVLGALAAPRLER